MNISTKIDGLHHHLTGPAFELVMSTFKGNLEELVDPLLTARASNGESMKGLFPEVHFVVNLDPMLTRRPGDQINLTVQFAVGVLTDAKGKIVDANPIKITIAKRLTLKILTGNLIGLPVEMPPHHPSRASVCDTLPISLGD